MEAAIKRLPRVELLIALVLIGLGAGARLVPHPANFAPVTAIALFGGAVLPRRWAVWVPLAVMIASDLFIGFYDIMPIVWACYVVIALASSTWLRRPSLLKGAALTVGASIFFFMVTNFAVWAFGGMYAHTVDGLAQCYVLALPFLRSSLLSDLLYTGLLFGALHYARAGIVQLSVKAAYLR